MLAKRRGARLWQKNASRCSGTPYRVCAVLLVTRGAQFRRTGWVLVFCWRCVATCPDAAATASLWTIFVYKRTRQDAVRPFKAWTT